MKVIPEQFYEPYFSLIRKDLLYKEEELDQRFMQLNFIYEDDSDEDKAYFSGIIKEMMELLGRPFHQDEFDFADDDYFRKIFMMGETLSQSKKFRESARARGARDGLYINRTYFGLYNILHELKSLVISNQWSVHSPLFTDFLIPDS